MTEDSVCRECGQPAYVLYPGYCFGCRPVIAVDMPYDRYPAHTYYYLGENWDDVQPGEIFCPEQCPDCGLTSFEVTASGNYLKCVGVDYYDGEGFHEGCGAQYPIVVVEQRRTN